MKKIIYSTVGTAFLFQEKIKELLEDLIQNQHYTEEEGKRIVDEFFLEINTNVGNVKSQIELNFDKIIKKYNLEQYVKWKEHLEQLMNDWKATSLLPTKIKHYK
jgi:polyhydroxyalkanoate synthesis regulator phasin